ncbi:MAG TPA: hypothetical protein PK325_03105 [Cyclobacteriaceae bacterium]|nr:hypothetical protein [Cyclobacteriaceae bacterium]HMV10887.1 hypothetical protein [Cyclobacteriaceae bacterium]HMV88884.1 hypothetical protein [Cyclobacteriaceae bacterium]HMW99672.1 hypothetical protein [Cyclobacteriaceae bacterium]HMY94199.1 hypothetical protein [Cyclobacteriaceae bacterium]
MKKNSIQIVSLLSVFLLSLAAEAQTFDFNALQGMSLTINLPPNTNRMVDYQSGVVVGIHTHLFQAPAQVTAAIDNYGGNVVLIPIASGFYIENVGRKKAIKTIAMDVEYGLGGNVLYIAVNGTNNFVPVSLGQTVTISGVQVTFPPAQAPGHQNFKGKVTLKGKKLKSVFIGSKTVVKELYVDNINVR